MEVLPVRDAVTVPPIHPYLVRRGKSGKSYLPLDEGNCWTVGRSKDNDLVIPDRWMSRHHAILQYMDNGELFLIDLGSRNGSFVNGRRVSIPVALQSGDRLVFGQTELEFYHPAQPHSEELEESEVEDLTATLHVRRLISVMVIDIRGFTVMTRNMDEKVLSEMIGSWFRQCGNILREHGSWVDKYIGDAVMAVWFHTSEGVRQQEIARIFAAIDALHEVSQKLSQQYPVPFPMRIGAGLNTGYAMVGNTGTGDRPDYTALGDTVNAAFRLESATKEIKQDVAIGETTYSSFQQWCPDSVLFQPHTVNLKGYETPIATYTTTFDQLHSFIQQQTQSRQ
ncbi:adenylate/guanylate cyclase domain-containing protein [Geitlerinema sp. PCC 9228]|uniref:adenylate/guanylate cyclase domain-containing protein n=1 Tax=Geitlerinema sp. PCC 9228 TaxID=111611 RepID=UPI001FCD8FF0|nr:adenylate/guanylate cyclase domain-containing protein [Geitlerinema sp. PCC 9228]